MGYNVNIWCVLVNRVRSLPKLQLGNPLKGVEAVAAVLLNVKSNIPFRISATVRNLKDEIDKGTRTRLN